MRTRIRIAAFALVTGACGGDAPTSPSLRPTAAETDPTAAFYLPVAGTHLLAGADGLYTATDPSSGVASSRYQDRQCGVHAKMFATAEKSGSGDAIMHTDNPRYSDRKCPAYPRRLGIRLTDPVTGDNPNVTEYVPVLINANRIQGPGFRLPIDGDGDWDNGGWSRRGLTISTGGTCGYIAFTGAGGSDSVQVRRTSGDTWEVRSEPGAAKGWCANRNQLFHFPFQLTVQTSRDLPS